MAVHCHAGLGRTGVLVACYLIFILRCKPNDVINYVRLKRPNSIQTRVQIACVQQFGQVVLPQFLVFTNISKRISDFTLNQYLTRQWQILHGTEARHLRYIPKIIYVLCEHLLRLANRHKRTFTMRGRQISLDNCIDYDVKSLDGFSNYFLSAQSPDEVQRRPMSQLTLRWSETSSPEPPRTQESVSGYSSDHSQYSSSDYCLPPIGEVHSKNYREFDRENSSHFDRDRLDALLEHVDKERENSDAADSSNSDYDPENLSGVFSDSSSPRNLSDNVCYQELNALKAAREQELETDDESEDDDSRVNEVVQALLSDHCMLGSDFQVALRQYEKDLNSSASAWERLQKETNLLVLTGLLWAWLEHLKEPVINKQDLVYIVLKAEKPLEALARLDRGTRYTLEYLIRFMSRLRIESEDTLDDLLRRLVAALTHQCLKVQGILCPVGSKWYKMREGTASRTMLLIHQIYVHVCEQGARRPITSHSCVSSSSST